MKIRVGIVLACALFASGGLAAAEELRASVGALAGVSLGVQPARSTTEFENYLNDLMGSGSQDSASYKDTWTTISGTVFFDAIFGYIDVSVAGIVGTIHTEERKGAQQPISYENDASGIGISNLAVTVSLGVKAPIVISEFVTLFPIFGLDFLFFGRAPNMGFKGIPFRIGAGGDFSFDKNLFIRTTIDYVWPNYTNFKAGIGTKL